MSDVEQQPEQPEEPAVDELEDEQPAAEDAAEGPKAPFRVHGSDGSERGPFQDLETAQEALRQLKASHEAIGDGVEFVIKDARGES